MEIDPKKLEILLFQNKEMKEIINKCYNGYNSLDKVIQFETIKTINFSVIMRKIPLIKNLISNENKDLKFFNKDFLNKIKKYIDESPFN